MQTQRSMYELNLSQLSQSRMQTFVWVAVEAIQSSRSCSEHKYYRKREQEIHFLHWKIVYSSYYQSERCVKSEYKHWQSCVGDDRIGKRSICNCTRNQYYIKSGRENEVHHSANEVEDNENVYPSNVDVHDLEWTVGCVDVSLNGSVIRIYWTVQNISGHRIVEGEDVQTRTAFDCFLSVFPIEY